MQYFFAPRSRNCERKECIRQGTQGLLRPIVANHHASDSIPQTEDIEIDQQAHSHSAEAQVGKQLCFVNRMDRLS